MSEQIIVIGGGGHAKVVIDCIRSAGDTVLGILDDSLAVGGTVLDVPVLGKTEEYVRYADKKFIIAIGNNTVRRRLAEAMDAHRRSAELMGKNAGQGGSQYLDRHRSAPCRADLYGAERNRPYRL